MLRLYKKLHKHFLAHKIIGSLVLVIVLWGGYASIKHFTDNSGETRYVTAPVEKGTIVSAVTGSGQVSASSQVEIKSKVSGDIVYLPVISGQAIPAGTLIAQVDARDAQIGLESARLALAKLVKPADAVSLLQSENALADAVQSNKQASDNLVKAYDDGFSDVADTFLDLPSVMTGLDNLLNSYQSNGGFLNDSNARAYGQQATNYRDKALDSFFKARQKYEANLLHYKDLTRNSATSSLEKIITETYGTVRSTTDAVKDAKNAVDFIRSQQLSADNSTAGNNAVANLTTWTSSTNSHLVDLLAAQNTIQDEKSAIITSAQNVREKQEALLKLKQGPDALDIQTEELNVKQKENAYADYFIRAPFAGLVAKLNVKKGDSISGGTSLATFITHEKMADISLNEVDVARVKVGQKVTLTFDAVDGLSITGEVRELDLVGTINQGVVTYNVKVGFDTEDDRVKAGMSATAAIVTDVKPDVLIVPNSAVKASGDAHTVEVMVGKSQTPESRTVEIGLADDNATEILAGLQVGEVVVTRTILPASAKPAAAAPSLFGASAPRTVTGGGARTGGR